MRTVRADEDALVAQPVDHVGCFLRGRFERVAPENPGVVLVTEEGDGRFRGE